MSASSTPTSTSGPEAKGRTGTESDDDRKARERVERLLGQPPVRSTASVELHNGRRLAYEVVAAYVPVAKQGLDGRCGDPQAAVFTTAYLAQVDGQGSTPTTATTPGAAPSAPRTRPVCFAFNGGPGSASLWLHLGALGPRRVAMPADGHMPRPPYSVVDNPLTWLEHADLVFIDPPHTGWSTTSSEEARKQLLSVDGDVDALVEVMRVWLARHRRFDTPVYLVGESYGTTRAAAMAEKLLDTGIALSGLVLVSCAMDLQCLVFGPAHDLPYAVFLPGLAAVAQYHGLVKGAAGQSAEAARAAAEEYANGDYLRVLHAGARLSVHERRRAEQRIAELTGLAPALVAEKNLRISDATFFAEALRDRGLIVGRLDARVTGPMGASRSRDWEFDPGMDALCAPYIMAAMAYFADLGLDTETRYVAMSDSVNESWNWNRGKTQGNAYACTTPDLARALRRHPHLKVLVASGWYDLGTPYSATDWSLAQLDAPADVLARITHRYYAAGHMMYTRDADLKQLKADLACWLAET